MMVQQYFRNARAVEYLNTAIIALIAFIPCLALYLGYLSSLRRIRRKSMVTQHAPPPQIKREIPGAQIQTVERQLALHGEHCAQLGLSGVMNVQIMCPAEDATRYAAYMYNAADDLCSKARSQPEAASHTDKICTQLVFLRHNRMHKWVKEAESPVGMVHKDVAHISNVFSVLIMDTLTKVSEHIGHCPSRVSFLFDEAWRSFRVNSANNVCLTLPPLTTVLRGHEELQTADKRQGYAENKVTLYDLDVYGPLQHIRRRLTVPHITITSLLKLAYYWPVFQIKLWVVLGIMYYKNALTLEQAASIELVVAVVMRAFLILLHLVWLRTIRKTYMVQYLIKSGVEVVLCFGLVFLHSPVQYVLGLRVASYLAFNVGLILYSALPRRRPMISAVGEVLFSASTIVFTTLLVIAFESTLYSALVRLGDTSVCVAASVAGSSDPRRYINGCVFMYVFIFITWLGDVYMAYVLAISAIGIITGIYLRSPRITKLTFTALKRLNKKLFGPQATRATLSETCKIILKGVKSLRTRDLVSNEHVTQLTSALALSEGTTSQSVELIKEDDLSFDMNKFSSGDLSSVFFNLFSHAAQFSTPACPSFDNLPSVTHLLPVCGETLLYTTSDLISGENILKGLVYNHESDFDFLVERLKDEGMLSTDTDAERIKWYALNGGSPSMCEYAVDDKREQLDFEVRMWASLRAQTVARTLMGLCKYGEVLVDLLKAREGLNEQQARQKASLKAQVLLCDQIFANKPTNRSELESVLSWIDPALPVEVAFDYDGTKVSPGRKDLLREEIEEFWFRLHHESFHKSRALASVRMIWDSNTQTLRLAEVLPRTYPLRIGFNKDNLTQGKSGNQRNGMLFARGEVVQAIDANQCWYYLECLYAPIAVGEIFGTTRQHKVPRYRIVGFCERIFSMNLSPVGAAEGLSEFGFGTLIQRVLGRCGVRLHYGHPDFVEASFAKYFGGMSHANAKLSLSEDVFEGMKALMWGFKSLHVDYLQMGKGRETNLSGATKFNSKIAMGSGAGVNRSPDTLQLIFAIDHWRASISYLSLTAFYDFYYLIIIGTVWFVITLAVFALQKDGPVLEKFIKKTTTISPSLIQLQLGVIPIIIGCCEVSLRSGLLKGVLRMLSATVLGYADYVFQSVTRYSAYGRALLKRKAVYVATGRTIGYRKENIVTLIVSYLNTHLFLALTILEYVIMYQLLVAADGHIALGFLNIIVMALVIVMTPALYNPNQNWDSIRQDFNKLSQYVLLGQDRTRVVSADRKDVKWHELDFDFGLAEIARRSFANMWVCDFFRAQDTWEFNLLLWVLTGVVKTAFLIALSLASDVNKNVLALFSLTWAAYASYTIMRMSRQLSAAEAVYVSFLAGVCMLASSAMWVMVAVRTDPNSIGLFDVVGGFWLVMLLLRRGVQMTMQFTSLITFRSALLDSRAANVGCGDGTSLLDLNKAYTLQESIYWILDRIYLISLPRLISGAFTCIISILGAYISLFVWKFYLPHTGFMPTNQQNKTPSYRQFVQERIQKAHQEASAPGAEADEENCEKSRPYTAHDAASAGSCDGGESEEGEVEGEVYMDEAERTRRTSFARLSMTNLLRYGDGSLENNDDPELTLDEKVTHFSDRPDAQSTFTDDKQSEEAKSRSGSPRRIGWRSEHKLSTDITFEDHLSDVLANYEIPRTFTDDKQCDEAKTRCDSAHCAGSISELKPNTGAPALDEVAEISEQPEVPSTSTDEKQREETGSRSGSPRRFVNISGLHPRTNTSKLSLLDEYEGESEETL